ncbi:hypothetical protein ANN_22934 [Periplaneta americana]|uniref:Uncharacterized protein n=1 Tax=Periplaneta americana TaxID=6978 RepID=A0ABQ8SKH9_PERAM|nr:hypothetical protein ANN_22934 [Periplaneta americana]
MLCPSQTSGFNVPNYVSFINQQVYQPPLPPTIEYLRVRITEPIALVNGPMLQRVWQEIDYRLDVCRVTQGAHIEHM